MVLVGRKKEKMAGKPLFMPVVMHSPLHQDAIFSPSGWSFQRIRTNRKLHQDELRVVSGSKRHKKNRQSHERRFYIQILFYSFTNLLPEAPLSLSILIK
jgi:hypothetical protein